jgi:hypothetical protein
MNIIYVEDVKGRLTRITIGCDDETNELINFLDRLDSVVDVTVEEMPLNQALGMLKERTDAEMHRVRLILNTYYQQG